MITNYCLEKGVVPYPGGGSADGRRGDHIQLTPPINITAEELQEMMDRIEAAIERASKELV